MKKILKLWVGARVQLTDNLDVEDKLCNCSEGTVKYVRISTSTNSAKDGGTIYAQFDNEKSGNKRKVKFSFLRVAKLCNNTSKGKEIFIFTTWGK